MRHESKRETRSLSVLGRLENSEEDCTVNGQFSAAGSDALRDVKRDRLVVLMAWLAGTGSLLLMLVFLFAGSLDLIDLGLSEPASMALNVGLSLVFFVQHSSMVRPFFRQWLARSIQEKYHGAVYTIVSGLFLVTVLIFWQESSYLLASAQGWPRVTLQVLFVLSFLGFRWALRSFGKFDLFGIKALHGSAADNPPSTGMLQVRGAYRWVRHPLYFFTLLMIWTCPHLTADRLLFNVLWSAWIVVGTILEERDLETLFGEDYRDYQRHVPMLIPNRIRPAR